MSTLGKVLIPTFAATCLMAQLAPPPAPISNGPAPVLTTRPTFDYNGSIPEGQVSPTPIPLTLRDAIQRGLRTNLGVLSNRDLTDLAALDRRRALSTLLPNLSVGFSQHSLQNDLVAFGLMVPGFPSIVGPFQYEDVRAFAQQTVFDRPSLRNLKSAGESLNATRLDAEQARNVVVNAVANGYLQVISDEARVTAIDAEVATARALFERANDQKSAGTVAGIDVLRSEVQFRNEQHRLLAQQNQVEKNKLALARAIGLPSGQTFNLVDRLPYAPLSSALDDLLVQAYQHRPDYKAAQSQVKAAEYAVDAARSEHWPSLVVQGDYGDVGPTLAHSHGTYSVTAGIRVPVYAGGRTKVDVEQAETVLRSRRNDVENLRGRIDYEIRTAFLDLQSSAQQVEVAQRNADLANQTLTQARDRLSAGVTDSIEVVQAQQLLAAANENYIASLNAHNAAKIALAAALGIAEEGVPRYLNLQP